MADIGHPTPQLAWPSPEVGFRELGRITQNVMNGQVNNVGTITLTASVATSTLSDRRLTPNSKIFFTATTANAAAEIGNGTMYVSAVTDDSATITHANNAQADRTFFYMFSS